MRSPQNKARPKAANKRAVPILLLIVLLSAVPTLILLRWLGFGPNQIPHSTARDKAERGASADAAYAGSQSCRDCHQEAFHLWVNSHHGQAERAIDPALDRAAFDPARTFPHGSQTSEARLTNAQFQIVTAGPSGSHAPFPVERVVGVTPLRQYLVPQPGGRFQVTEVAFDPNRGDWFDIFGAEDRRPGEWGHWTGRGMTWNMMCAGCHNTRVRKNYRADTDAYATTMAERSVGCEACHGPMAAHVKWQWSNPSSPSQPRKIADPTLRRLDREQGLSMCGSCHARRSELTGDFQPGDRFLDHFSPVIPDESDIYFPDGQVRDEDYEYVSFLSSRMHDAGVRCLDCHQPHSAKTLTSGDSLCLRCHAAPIPPAPKIEPATHSHHPPDKAGSHCVDCHMPQTTYMQRHARRDHGFTIPDPWLTQQHGIPNACNRCHTDRSTNWAREAVEKWYGSRMERPSRQRAQSIAQAKAGQHEAAEKLVRLTRDETNSLWRASATALLKRWATEPGVAPALLERVGDSAPLVRGMAARALEPLEQPAAGTAQAALRRLLNDPVRLVRIEAAWSLRASLETNSPAALELRSYLEFNNDQPSGALQLGTYLMDRGDLEKAAECFARAVRWDGGSAPLRHAWAVALSLQGKRDDAVRELETACRLAPREAEYSFKLGLAYNEAGKLAQARASLEQAVKLDPQFAQAWYNLGLAYSALELPERALEALARTESLSPSSPTIPYARATILARLGRNSEARTAAQRTLELQPNHADAAQLLQVLSSRER